MWVKYDSVPPAAAWSQFQMFELAEKLSAENVNVGFMFITEHDPEICKKCL